MATLVDVYAELFPDDPNRRKPFGSVPLLPADLFAFSAHLLERSGAYHHVVPVVNGPRRENYRKVLVDAEMRNWATTYGRVWRSGLQRPLPNPPPEVAQVWEQLEAFRGADVYEALDETADPPGWWRICLLLLMVSDEASVGIGFDPQNPFTAFTSNAYVQEDLSSGEVFRRIKRAPFSLSSAAEDVLCVQAKSRTPSVGCTLRSLTHHLALLPPRGEVRARWVEPPFDGVSQGDQNELGLLLIPFPYRVTDDSFHPAGLDPSEHWGWFRAKQTWLPDDKDHSRRRGLISFVHNLIDSARQSGDRVDSVVLPELALNYHQFLSLARSLAKDRRIDFLISGVSQNEHGRHGNFVAIAPFFLLGPERSGQIQGWERLILVREKHHRWKMSGEQLDNYGLMGLDSSKSWWEDLTILGRSLDVMVYRNRTTLTTLICEDLARVDPCQAVVRAVGPDLLIALLMDGPQLGHRWPGRYATVLADDPGTSVLCFTSFGLIARQNDIGKFDQASSIALWKDEKAGIKPLELSREADALLLHIEVKQKNEHTLDGRSDGGASNRWEYKGHRQVTASSKPSWIASGEGRR